MTEPKMDSNSSNDFTGLTKTQVKSLNHIVKLIVHIKRKHYQNMILIHPFVPLINRLYKANH